MPPWYAGPPTPAYASFWRRLGGALIDGLALAPLTFSLMAPMWREVMDQVNLAVERGTRFDATDLMQRSPGVILAIAVVTFAYQAVMVGMWGATVGKFAVSVRVRKADGSNASWREALLRPVLQAGVSLVSLVTPIGILSPVDYLWMLWDRQKQTLHDKVASTIVVLV